jgi:hypothetical protein
MLKVITLIGILFIAACSPLDIISGMMGSGSGVDATVQVAEEANKGVVAIQAGVDTDIKEVRGDATVTNNSTMGMATMALIGMIPFALMVFYFLPQPKWLQEKVDLRKHNKRRY